MQVWTDALQYLYTQPTHSPGVQAAIAISETLTIPMLITIL